MGKSVKVHDDTHQALKQLKSSQRSRSFDQVIRHMIRATTGVNVEEVKADSNADGLTKYLDE